jgi:hypothetical protein
LAAIDQATTNTHAIVTVIVRQDTWNTALSNLRHVQVTRQNFVASTVAGPCCCGFIYRLEAIRTHQRCNFLDLEFSSDRSWPTGMLITFQTVSSLCKTFVPLKHGFT